MTTLLVHCDRCSAPIEEGRTELLIECGPLRIKRQAVDLCRECLGGFTRWLEVTEPEAVVAVEPVTHWETVS